MSAPTTPRPTPRAEDGRLLARPTTAPAQTPPAPGTHRLGMDASAERDALLYIPADYDPERPAPFALMLHGAGGEASHGLELLRPLADAAGLVLLAPASRGRTWDVIARGGYGPDIALLDGVLFRVFARVAIDPTRVALGGFSDGASYALSVGLMNGSLFSHLIAFAPGFAAPLRYAGAPRVYVAHGTRDAVLPIDRCSRRLVPELRAARREVRYDEFDGPHTVPPTVARAALDWFLGTP